MSLLVPLLVPYGLAVLVLIRPLAGMFAWRMYTRHSYHHGGPDGLQWFGALLIAICLAAVWPLLLGWQLAEYLPKLGAEREHELQVARERIRELEEELLP